MKWILVLIGAWIAYVIYKGAQSGSTANDAAWNALADNAPDGTIPIQTSGGLSGYLQSDGTIVDSNGTTIGIMNSSGARPGEAGGVTDLTAGDP
jgi:hypothetical protein